MTRLRLNFGLGLIALWLAGCGSPAPAQPTVQPTAPNAAAAPTSTPAAAPSPSGGATAAVPVPAAANPTPAASPATAFLQGGSVPASPVAGSPVAGVVAPVVTVLPTLTPAPSPTASAIGEYVSARALIQARTPITRSTVVDALRIASAQAPRSDVVSTVQRARDELVRARDALKALQPPAAAAESHTALLDAYALYVEGATTAAEAMSVTDGQARIQQLATAGDRITRGAAAEERSNALLRAIQGG